MMVLLQLCIRNERALDDGFVVAKHTSAFVDENATTTKHVAKIDREQTTHGKETICCKEISCGTFLAC